MAKRKLFIGNYVLDTLNSLVILPDNIAPERLLLITDVTINKIIYNFSDPNFGYNQMYYSKEDEKTFILLTADLTSLGVNDSDKLQIFIDNDHQEVEFSETFIDPVSKIRVSNPGNLIDTDFEYGTQSSKWETLQTINNIPTIYSSSGEIPLENVVSVEVSNGSKQVKVTTSSPHALNIGDPISVQGLTEYLAEGSFLISGLGGTRIFFYEMDKPVNKSGKINGSYTTIIPSKFFEGSNILLDEESGSNITTDNQTPSIITANTKYTHGFDEKTKVYLRNTVGPKDLEIQDSTATSQDGRPAVDLEERLATTISVDSTSDTSRSDYLKTPIVTRDWSSTYNKLISETTVNTVDNYVYWPSHNLKDNYCLLYSDPIREKSNMGLVDGTVYYVKVIDTDNIQLCSDYETLTNVVTLSVPDVSFGYPSFNLVYKVEGHSTTLRNTSYYQRGTGSGSSSNYNPYIATETIPVLIGSVASLGTITSLTLNSVSGTKFSTSSIYYSTFTYPGSSRIVGNVASAAYSYVLNANIISGLYQSGGNYYFNYTISPRYVNRTYSITLYFSYASSIAVSENFSGSDLKTTSWGLGNVTPDRIVAFQQRESGVGSFVTTDSFSYLAQQRTYGRYTSINPYYNYTPTTSYTSGRFSLNYSNAGSASYGPTSEVFYAFAKNNTAHRNTIYYSGHGLEDGDTVTISVPNYDTTNSFYYNSNIGDAVQMPETFDATVSKVSNSILRLQTVETPTTDDIAKFPSQFSITKNVPNPTYNTIYVSNHKITSNATATYTAADPIGGLTSSTEYLLERYDDSRLYVRETTLADATTATTTSVGNTLQTPVNFDINFSTPLGTTPSTATITGVEFRGNFGRTSEYVTVTFEDGYSFDVGVYGVDSSVWQTDTRWTSKDVSSLLKAITGGTGITVTFDPSSNVNYSMANRFGGMTNYWEIRFTITGQTGTLVLSSTGSGSHIFAANSIDGAYDGIYTINSLTSANSIKLDSDFKIPNRTYNFTETAIDNISNTITLTTSPAVHNLVTGEKITYNAGIASPMFDTTDGTDAYVIAVDSHTISLAGSYLDAKNNLRIPLSANAGTHQLISNNICKSIVGVGTVSASANGSKITGNGTRFRTDYKRFDKIWIISNGYMQEYTINRVLTDDTMYVDELFQADITNANHYYITQIIPRPDGYNLHKPFDGGIDITAGTSPRSKITRQTRKYFRYQSGKGIQNSFAINFSPSKIVNFITADGDIATVQTQELHNLNVGEQIYINDAEVAVGENYYNGLQTVTEIIDAYNYKYQMSGIPEQNKASGYPSYSRNGWRDSAIRAGMFDDQNGFFYEYDGTSLYAVRRSSTLQLSGYCDTTKGSQIITGQSTSFSTQLNNGDNIVVRGQTYKVVEISSDNRLIVQPAYRGVSASKVKITKTIDTKVPQHEWNIDRCDGTGSSGFVLDINKIQMCYADYSWYGAGKIRFGFKDQNGHVKYVHEFKHNNRLLESYFRSGNLPGRYEIENFANPNTAPTLFHFGTSVIMDGRFDDDKAYLFSEGSKPFVFTNGTSSTFTSTGTTIVEQITVNGSLVYVYAIPVAEADALKQTVGILIRDPNNTYIPEGSYVVQVKVAGTSSKIYVSYPGTTTDPGVNTIASGTVFTVGEINSVDLTKPIPLISLRLAPSVDSGVTGAVGERDIINRMQLALKTAGITTNKNLEVYFILNGSPSNLTYSKVQSPSLSEIIRYSSGDLIQGGNKIYSTKTSSGSLDIDLSQLTDMGNSILGGDSIFPSGPDLLTVAVLPQDTSTISGTSPLICSGKITWTESQA